jgi:hypothetical protein
MIFLNTVLSNCCRNTGRLMRTINAFVFSLMLIIASHASAAITPAEIFLTVINKPYVAPSCVDSDDTCDFTVSVSVGSNTYLPTQEYSYAWGFVGAPLQLSDTYIKEIWKSHYGKTFNYLQTSNFDGYVTPSTPKPTTVSVTDKTGKATAMRLSYGTQYWNGTGTQGSTLPWVFTLSELNTIGDGSGVAPYQFTIHAYDGDESRELAVWLSSKYDNSSYSYTNVSTLFSQGHRNHWKAVGDSHIAYVGGLYEYAKANDGGFTLNLDRDLDGSLMNLSTSYVLYRVDGDANTCAKNPSSCNLTRIGQQAAQAAVVTGPIVIAGSGRISGYQLLFKDYDNEKKWAEWQRAEYLINSGLLSLSSSHGTYDNFAAGAAIDVSGITIGFSPKRGDSSVFLNNQYVPMCKISDAINKMCPDRRNNKPVKVFDFKMVGNWVDAADGLEVQGDGSELKFAYLHVADDSMKVAAENMTYNYTTVLQGDVSTGGVIDLGSYGTASSKNSNVKAVYVHRITHKPVSPVSCPEIGYCGAALVAAPTCEFGRDVTHITVKNLWVNNLGDGINSVNRPFNIGLGPTAGAFGLKCGAGDMLSQTTTNVTNLVFKDFSIYLNPLSNSTFFNRGNKGGQIDNINFFDGKVNDNVAGKVAIYGYGNDFAYFICGPPASPLGCWNTSGVGGKANPTFENVTYDSSGKFTRINFPYTPPTP